MISAGYWENRFVYCGLAGINQWQGTGCVQFAAGLLDSSESLPVEPEKLSNGKLRIRVG